MSSRARLAGSLLCAVVASGCYVSTPIDIGVAPPAMGDMIVLDISDKGRVALAERLGPGVTGLEGRLVAMTGTTFELQVYKVAFLRAGESRWSGERVSIDREHVSHVQGRILSRSRTAATAAIVGGGIIAFIITRQILASGRERDPSDTLTGPISTLLPHVQVIH